MISNALRYKTTCSGQTTKSYRISRRDLFEKLKIHSVRFMRASIVCAITPARPFFILAGLITKSTTLLTNLSYIAKQGENSGKSSRKSLLDLLWRAATVGELADTMEEWRRIQDVCTDFWPARAEDKTVIK